MKNLKTVLTLIFAVFTITAASFSQQGVSLGLEGGLNLANANLKPTLNNGSKTGFMIGGFVDIGVSKYVSIKPAIRYITKGFELRNNFGVTYTENLSYIEFPMLVNVNLPLNQVKPYFELGPTLGIQLSANEEATDGVNFRETDVSTAYESIDF
ncbi:MAG: PorT family protein [Ignavibacteria bacterium]|nr:PorT family protein [Ignavibacteria bacterium]